jgi:tetraacyldisaccharide 4'-kinase
MTLETHLLDIIEGKKAAPVTRALLRLLSQGYRAGVSTRHFLYDWVLPVKKAPLPVISVGNIVAGGTGKTPIVHYLANFLAPKKVAILTRGYRRKGSAPLLLNPNTPVEACGDEPYLLFQKLPDAKILVGKNRFEAAQIAPFLKVDLLLLDDGMQHRRLHRDLEIGVLHAGDLFGKGFYLPRGLLRDSPKRLEKAHLILLTGVKDQAHFDALLPLIRKYTQAPVTAMQLQVENSSDVASKKVAAFCAIAAPQRFHDTLKTLGCDTVLSELKPDHVPFEPEELERLANRAQALGAQCLVCTEKDAVKLPKELKLPLPLIPLKIALYPTFGKEHLKTIQEVIP